VAACLPDVFYYFYFVKDHRNVNNSTTAEAGEKINLGSVILEIFDAYLTKFKTDQILLNRISYRFVATTKVCTS
jgi:hypothetical protein